MQENWEIMQILLIKINFLNLIKKKKQTKTTRN